VDDEIDSRIREQDDRRQHDRSRLLIDVYFDGKDATGVASTKDISVGGLYMNTQATLPRGSVLLLRIPLQDGQLVANAEVVYVNEGSGVGLQFQGLSAEDRVALQRELEGS
jgi:hypothetical protein